MEMIVYFSVFTADKKKLRFCCYIIIWFVFVLCSWRVVRCFYYDKFTIISILFINLFYWNILRHLPSYHTSHLFPSQRPNLSFASPNVFLACHSLGFLLIIWQCQYKEGLCKNLVCAKITKINLFSSLFPCPTLSATSIILCYFSCCHLVKVWYKRSTLLWYVHLKIFLCLNVTILRVIKLCMNPILWIICHAQSQLLFYF